MSRLSEEIVKEARMLADPQRENQIKRYFREPIETYGLTTAQIKMLAKRYYPRVKGNLDAAMCLAESLLETKNMTLGGIGLEILDRFRGKLGPQHLDAFDRWVDHLNNWATTDGLATHMIAASIAGDPSQVERLIVWSGSPNRWRRRAAAVSLVPLARKGHLLEYVLRVADGLMEDDDDMVQKGVGWLLKEASKMHPEEIHDYLLRWRTRAPALLLRIASEKLPKDKRVLKTGARLGASC